ncbi:phosphoribosyltransferase family protein [Nocardioides pacificus]
MTVFLNREDAGRRLAAALAHLRHEDPVVLGIPRGGVAVAAEVSRGLCATLDVVVVRKLGVPRQPDLAMGVVGEGGVVIHHQQVIAEQHIAGHDLADARRREDAEVARRARRWRRGAPRVALAGRVVVLVDDGMATGATMQTACRVVLAEGARRVVVTAPVASSDAVELLADLADEVVVLGTPATFSSVGEWYVDFEQVSDDDVTRVLTEGPAGRTCADVHVPVVSVLPEARSDLTSQLTQGDRLGGLLTIPPAAAGIVVFAHGAGSDRSSARNGHIAEELCHLGLATLLLDMLTPDEAAEGADIGVEALGARLVAVCRWLALDPRTAGLPVGLFGAGSGAAAALVAASDPAAGIRAVVSRGGQLEQAADRLPKVSAPTLLVVGGADTDVLTGNEQAQHRLGSLNELVVVPGAGHFFEEPGALDAVSRVTSHWFTERLGAPGM